jgi:hypothetical protein
MSEGMGELLLADRATIANMSPEYGATMGFFPVDHFTLQSASSRSMTFLVFSGISQPSPVYFSVPKQGLILKAIGGPGPKEDE